MLLPSFKTLTITGLIWTFAALCLVYTLGEKLTLPVDWWILGKIFIGAGCNKNFWSGWRITIGFCWQDWKCLHSWQFGDEQCLTGVLQPQLVVAWCWSTSINSSESNWLFELSEQHGQLGLLQPQLAESTTYIILFIKIFIFIDFYFILYYLYAKSYNKKSN